MFTGLNDFNEPVKKLKRTFKVDESEWIGTPRFRKKILDPNFMHLRYELSRLRDGSYTPYFILTIGGNIAVPLNFNKGEKVALLTHKENKNMCMIKRNMDNIFRTYTISKAKFGPNYYVRIRMPYKSTFPENVTLPIEHNVTVNGDVIFDIGRIIKL